MQDLINIFIFGVLIIIIIYMCVNYIIVKMGKYIEGLQEKKIFNKYDK
jgi:hypothetical protein